jgi:peptidoglycan-associated lipoprotein
MRTTLKLIATAAALAIAFVGCGTTPESQAPAKVEERSGPSTSPSTVKTPPVAQVDVTGRPVGTSSSALKDPNNILSKRSIFYDYDKFDVRDEYRNLVEAHAKYLRENPGARMLIQGNADDRGSREYNLALGQRRAENVKRAMVLLGVNDKQVETVSFGAEKPVAFGQDEESWSKNRRSDLVYPKEPQ